jgi:MOSC domain-containing protein YiiM
MSELADRMRHVPQRGEITWIGLRPGHDEPMTQPDAVRAIANRGLDGDRASRASRGGKRQVTLIQAEHLPVIASLVGRTALEPALLRRNLVVRGVNLLSLKGLRFRVGQEVVLVGTGPCEPCGKMDRALGDGGFHAMRGHGGITARVLHGGVISLGDAVWADETLAMDGDELD